MKIKIFENEVKTFYLNSNSHLPKKKMRYLLQWKPFKNDEKCFLFHLKSSFRSQDKFLSWLFGHAEKNDLIRMRLFSKFITPQPGSQTIAIHILPNITRSKSNQTMKLGQ